MRIPSRLYFGSVFLACAALLGVAIYLQEQVGLDPCPMCILQRYAFTLIGLVALVATIHGPRGTALKVYGGLVAIFAIAGGGVAARQSYIQHYPPVTSSCGTDLDFLVNTFPLSQALPKIFAGSGDCIAVPWRLFGMSIAECALLWFAIFTAGAIWYSFFRKAA